MLAGARPPCRPLRSARKVDRWNNTFWPRLTLKVRQEHHPHTAVHGGIHVDDFAMPLIKRIIQLWPWRSPGPALPPKMKGAAAADPHRFAQAQVALDDLQGGPGAGACIRDPLHLQPSKQGGGNPPTPQV